MRIACSPAPTVISDTLEGDTIVIDVQSGAYYTLTETAGALWTQAQTDGACEAEGPAVDVLAALIGEGLLAGELDAAAPADTGIAFQRYTDMEELLLADPIHEVDAEGWPVLKPPTAGG